MQISMVGLGRMGLNMSLRLLKGRHKVVAYDRAPASVRKAVRAGAHGARSLEEMVRKLKKPRVVWLMIPAGRPVWETIRVLSGLLEKGDIVIDGGNSHYKDDA